MNRRLKYGGCRKKALLGEIIGAGSNLVAAGIQAAATAKAAKQQVDAIKDNAAQQAAAIQQQAENNNRLQEQQIELTKQRLDYERQMAMNNQMNLQLQAGSLSSRDRREASKIQVKYGGHKRGIGINKPIYFLQGRNNIGFRVTDGGSVRLVGITPEGYTLYELQGNDHKHYHKAQGGKYKTGVGIKFAGGDIVEGEGNQNTNQGEYMLTTPTDAYFISKHTLDGFNPTNAINAGMHPLDAYLMQENIKDINNINDDGSTPVAKNGGYMHRRLKCGGRHKAAAGFAPYWGAAATSLGNIGGAAITTIGNNIASKRLGKAYGEAADVIVDAYNNMSGIDMSAIDRSMFTPAYYMPAVRSSYVNVNPQLEQVARDQRNRQRAINNTTLSSAARLNRMNSLSAMADEARSRIYSDKYNREEQIKQANNQAINEAAARNAELAVQSNRDYSNMYYNMLTYNNDISNEKLSRIAEARANALTQSSAARAQAAQANAAIWAGAIGAAGQSFGNAYENYRKGREDFGNVALTANYAAMTPEQRAIFDKQADYYGYGKTKKNISISNKNFNKSFLPNNTQMAGLTTSTTNNAVLPNTIINPIKNNLLEAINYTTSAPIASTYFLNKNYQGLQHTYLPDKVYDKGLLNMLGYNSIAAANERRRLNSKSPWY